MGHPLIEVLLREAMGLDSASLGDSSIDRALRDRMSACEVTSEESYAKLLRSSPVEMQELIEVVVVPETWFFRNPEAFRALAVLTTDEWLPGHPTGVLRVLSFPCSTGEEPYSIAMTLLDAGLARDRFSVDGFDISARALARAEKGTFGRNSFRGGDLAFREHYFRQEKTTFILTEEVRRSVSFERRNMIEEDFARRHGEYDVIFCRNVLIYFDQPTQQRVLRNLDAALRPAGVLFVGPAESFQVAAAGFTSIPQPQAFVFRKGGAPRLETPAVPSRPAFQPAAANDPWMLRGGAAARRRVRPASRPPFTTTEGKDPSPARDAGSADNDLAAALRLADSGDLVAALAAAERHLTAGAPTAESYYILGLIRDAGGDARAATDSYRKALYLDPDHLDALIHLAFLLERNGDATSAERFRDRARRAEKRLKP